MSTRNIITGVAQRRHRDVNDIQAVEQIFAELTLAIRSRRFRLVAAMTRTSTRPSVR